MAVSIDNIRISDMGKRGLFTEIDLEGLMGVFNKECEIVIPFEFQFISETIYKDKMGQEYYIAQRNNTYGKIDVKTLDFTEIGRENFLESPIQTKDNKMGIVNPFGEFVVEPVYDDILLWDRANINSKYENKVETRYLLVKKDGDKFIAGIASNEKVLVEPKFDFIEKSHVNNFVSDIYYPNLQYPAFSASINGKYGYIDQDGNTLVDFNNKFTLSGMQSCITAKTTESHKFVIFNIETKEELYITDGDNVNDFYTNDFNTYFTVVTNDDKMIRIYNEKGSLIVELKQTEALEESHIYYLNNNCLLVQYGPYSNSHEEDLVNEFGEYLIDFTGKTISNIYQGIYLKKDTDMIFCKLLRTPETIDVLDNQGHLIETIEHASFTVFPNESNTRTFEDDILSWDCINDPDENNSYMWTVNGRVATSEYRTDRNNEIILLGIEENNTIYTYELDEEENKIVVRTIDGVFYSEADFICDQDDIYLDDEIMDF